MEINCQSSENTACCCKKLPYVIHELSQSLFIIQAYATGFIVRINENNIDLAELAGVLHKINQQVETMGTILHSMTRDKKLKR